MATPKTTEQIRFGSWTILQMRLSGANNFADTNPLDDVGGGGAGPFLVFDRGVWKYPQQATGGRIQIPLNLSRPVRVVNVMANFGASVAWTLNVEHQIDNTTGEPYDASDEALYETGKVEVASGTDQYLALNTDAADAGIAALAHPGDKVYITTTGTPSNALVRMAFTLANERD